MGSKFRTIIMLVSSLANAKQNSIKSVGWPKSLNSQFGREVETDGSHMVIS